MVQAVTAPRRLGTICALMRWFGAKTTWYRERFTPGRLSRFVGRVGATEGPTALMTDGAESLLRSRKLIPVPTRLVLDYFHVATKVRHADQSIGKIPPYAFSPNGSEFELYDRFNYLRGYLWSGRRDKFKKSFDRLLYLLDRVQSELPE